MKRSYKVTKKIGRKNIILSLVALILIMLTAVSVTYSWIEDVSEVKLSSSDGDESPLHITNNQLNSTVNIQSGNSTVDLSKYFYESGDMHLSPCLSDGENFYFPKKGSSSGYRLGTKNDVNVNYISATFKIKSLNARTAYWFEKISSSTPFFAAKSSDSGSSTNLTSYLRCSVTVDGSTTVYVNNTSQSTADAKGTYKYYNGSSVQTNSSARTMQSYSYYASEDASNYNQGNSTVNGHPNYNGNTLFSVSKYDSDNDASTTKTVTVKIWLEYNSSLGNMSAKLHNLNLKISSSWNKTRKITVSDQTINQKNFTSASNEYATGTQWLTNDAHNTTASLHWGFRDQNYGKHWDISTSTRNSTDYTINSYTSPTYQITIPAVYNGEKMDLFRCQDEWNKGNSNTLNGVSIKYWDVWETVYPDTFCNETYTVYNKEYATWNAADMHNVYYVNSAGAGSDGNNIGTALNNSNVPYTGTPGFGQNMIAHTVSSTANKTYPHSYMWDSKTTVQEKTRVVQNGEWYGLPMVKMNDTAGVFGIYSFYFSSDYDKIIFNDGAYDYGSAYQYQTQDISVSGTQNNGKYFDMATLSWYNNKSSLPSYTSNYISSNIANGANIFANTAFCYKSSGTGVLSGTSTSYSVCQIYNKSSSDGEYKFKVYYNNKWYGANEPEGGAVMDISNKTTSNQEWKLYENQGIVRVKVKGNKISRFYLKMDNGQLKIYGMTITP